MEEEKEIITAEENSTTEGAARFFSFQRMVKNIPFFLFLAVLGMVHIANNHWAVNQVRAINKKGKELKEMRWEYLTTKSDLMYRSKQSEIIKSVEQIGLKELVHPPQKIIINEEEYKTED